MHHGRLLLALSLSLAACGGDDDFDPWAFTGSCLDARRGCPSECRAERDCSLGCWDEEAGLDDVCYEACSDACDALCAPVIAEVCG